MKDSYLVSGLNQTELGLHMKRDVLRKVQEQIYVEGLKASGHKQALLDGV